MSTTRYTFWKLLNEYSIEVPIIQRDYAQGRLTDKINAIRITFLYDIYSSLTEETELELDFVYGDIKKNIFTPLDGQQRLTTLFLLHWYLSITDGRNDFAIPLLCKFTYQTRISAKEFIIALIENKIDIPCEGNVVLSDLIKDSFWFYRSWIKDPTVKSMLVVLDAIHDKFKNTSGLFDKLVNVEYPLIGFQFIAIEKYGLTDSIYIKMNARGKRLTDFEIFKAKFEQFLEKSDKVWSTNYREKFAYSIDGVWTDFFWNYKDEHSIDKPFMRLFNYVTTILYYIKAVQKTGYANPNPKIDFEIIEATYTRENVEFLFSVLDTICEIENLDTFFNSIFSTYQYEKNRVTLFESNVNLFSSCIKSDFLGVKEKVLLFTILRHIVLNDIIHANDDTRDLVRVVRNLLQRVRQQNNTTFNTNLRIESLPSQITGIISKLVTTSNVYDELCKGGFGDLVGFTKESLNYEKDKAKIIIEDIGFKEAIHSLEDNRLFKGSIHNLSVDDNKIKIAHYLKAINEIWSVNDDSLITRAMLTAGDYSIDTGGSKLGEKWYYGNSSDWHTILSNIRYEEKITEILPRFLDTYIGTEAGTVKEKLSLVISKWIDHTEVKDWKYYFIKYPTMTNSNNNLYAWNNEFEIRRLTGNTLLSVHLCPYLSTLAQILRANKLTITYYLDQYSETSPLSVGDLRLRSAMDGWKIYLVGDKYFSTELIAKYSLTPFASNHYYLKEYNDLDRIETAVAFCKEFIEAK